LTRQRCRNATTMPADNAAMPPFILKPLKKGRIL